MRIPFTSAPHSRVAPWLVAGLIALVVGLAYRGTFSVPFVLDDTQAITDNYSIRSFATAWSPPKDTTVTGRPVLNLSLAANYAIGELDVRGYHAFNLAIHVLAALALFGVVRRSLQNSRLPASIARDTTLIAGGIALLWAVHPLHTESVTYTIQRAESLVGLFYLLTVYCFIRGIDDHRQTRRGRGWLALSFVACLLGMATKEVMVSAPLIVLLYDRTFVAGGFGAALRARGRYYTALAATWLVLAALVISTEGRGGTAGLAAKISAPDYALTQCAAIAHYLRLAFWPSPLVFDYGRAVTTQFSMVLGPALLLLALGGGTIVALRCWPAVGFLGAWFFAILAPSSSVVPIATQTIAEHRMYLSLAAVIVLVVGAAYRWLAPRAATIGVGLAVIGLAWLTHQRNATYRDVLTLWNDTAAKAPANPRAFANLGITFLQLGRLPEAQSAFEAAVRLAPDDAETHINLANVLLTANRFDEGIAQLETALRLDPNNVEAENNLGITLAQANRLADALPHFERAVGLKPASAESHSNLGLALMQIGRVDDARTHLAESARLQPVNPHYRDSYGFALLRTGQLPEAIAEFEAALRFDPKLASAHNHLGLALVQSGRTTDGLAHLEQAVQLSPDDASMHNDLGVALAMAGRMADALRSFERAVELKPDFADAARNRDRARAELQGR